VQPAAERDESNRWRTSGRFAHKVIHSNGGDLCLMFEISRLARIGKAHPRCFAQLRHD
jgi:hypothetical protein